MLRMIALLLLAVPLGCAGSIGPREVDVAFAAPRDPQEAEARLRFLEERLDAGRLHAQLWYWSWLTMNTGGLASSVSTAVLSKHNDTRAFNIVQASQAAIGLTDMLVLRPMPGREGAAPLREAQARGDGLDERVKDGERLLVASADRAEQRRDWRVHVGNLVLQLIGASALLAIGEPGYAGYSMALGIVGGELNIWSEPGRAIGDLAAYRTLVAGGGVPGEPNAEWWIGPTARGIALQLRY